MADKLQATSDVSPADHVETTTKFHQAISEADFESSERQAITWQQVMGVLALASVFQGYLLTLIGPNAILSYINADLGPDPDYTWIAIAWNVGAATMITVGGRLADVFGRRYFFLAAPVIMAVGSIVGANGKSVPMMIVASAINGFGAGFGEMALGAVQEFVSYRLRVQILGITEATNLISGNGPLLAYVFIAFTKPGWRSIYWFNFSFQVLAFTLVFLFYKPPSFHTKHSEDGLTKRQILKKLDYVGLLLFLSGLVLLLVGITFGGSRFPWASAQVLCCILFGFALLVSFGLWTAYSKIDFPLIPRRLFHDPRKFLVNCCFITIANSLYYALGVLWPRQSGLLFVPANDTIMRGVYANMVSYGVILGSCWAAASCSRFGSEKWQLVAYMTIQTAIIGAMSSVGRNKTQAIVLILLFGCANQPISVLNFGMISLHLEDQADIGISQGLLSSFRLTGGAIATAIYSSIQRSKFASDLPGKVQVAATAAGFSGNLDALVAAATLNTAAAYKKVNGITPGVITAVTTAVEDAYIDAFRLVYLVAIAFGCVAILLALTAKGVPASRKTNSRAVQLENEAKPADAKLVALT